MTSRTCRGCGIVKPLGDFGVDSRWAEGASHWRYACKACDRKRVGERRLRNPEGIKASQRRYRARLNADPQRHAAYLETRRMAYRLREEAKGRNLDDIKGQVIRLPATPRGELRRLPAAPLGRAVEAVIARGERVDEFARNMVCERAGIPVRTLFRWTHDERAVVQFDVADRVVTRLDLQWWDVWDDDAAASVWEGQAAA